MDGSPLELEGEVYGDFIIYAETRDSSDENMSFLGNKGQNI